MAAVYQQVREEIERMPDGAVLTLEDFPVSPEQLGAVAKSLSRLQQQGTLKRLMKGLYFKPFMGVLGEVTLPYYDVLLQKLLELYKDRISYITGTNAYSSMSLTTQIANEVVIATDRPRAPLQIGSTKVRFIRSHITEALDADAAPVAVLLDAIWDIKDIPATRPAKAARILRGRVRALTKQQRQELARLALAYYPPQTRALTGLLLESVGEKRLAKKLKASLNPLTVFRLALDDETFPTSRTWNIL